jgi:hypothetical protein
MLIVLKLEKRFGKADEVFARNACAYRQQILLGQPPSGPASLYVYNWATRELWAHGGRDLNGWPGTEGGDQTVACSTRDDRN